MAAVNIRLNPLGMLVVAVTALVIFVFGMGLVKSPLKTSKVSMKELLSASIDLAKRGGIKVKEVHDNHQMHAEVKGQTKEGKEELKTEGDMKSHIEIVHGLHIGFPGIMVISEEHEKQHVDVNVEAPNKKNEEVNSVIGEDELIPASDITVWVDPLDATQEYTESGDLLKYVTVMVCVAVKGKPVIGVIHKPFQDETVWGWNNHGQSKNLPEKKKTSKPYKVIRSRSHAGDVDDVIKAVDADAQIIEAGGAGYKTLELIKGNADAYVHVTAIKKWDICAGNAIINTVGGSMTTLGGEEINYSSQGSPLNRLGLLATANDHNVFINLFKKPAADLKAKANV